MITVGMKGHYEMTVPEEQLAVRVDSGEVAVFATPMMIAAIEETAAGSVQPELEEGCTTVGTLVNVSHVAATPEEMKVTVETELTGISGNGRMLTFHVAARDEAGLIGEGIHERAVVKKARFEEKARAKADQYRGK